MSDPHEQIPRALDALVAAGLVTRYVQDVKRGYIVEWSPVGDDYARMLAAMMSGVSEDMDEAMWSAVSFLARLHVSEKPENPADS